MNQKLNLGLSLFAGLLGGIMSYRLSPRVSGAQEQAPPPKTITAERFSLRNERGTTVGVFGLKDDKANITLCLLSKGDITPPCGTPFFAVAFTIILRRCITSPSFILCATFSSSSEC